MFPSRQLQRLGVILLFLGVGHAVDLRAQPRPRVGVALGGGSARGIAHVGVLRWLEEHRIPIDLVSGTSMGGLIGGSYATGMTPDEIEAMLAGIDWTEMFDSSDFPFQNVRRKRDSRAYPSHLEFGLKKGLSTQPSLNSGQQVDLLIERITAPYYAIGSFDELPTPIRTVALDLLTASRVVLGSGSLARALRATMSLPAVFPPVSLDGKVLVDGGTVDNVPADVAHDMGAAHVIAVNVGDLRDKENISPSLLGIAGSTLDAMMRANTVKGLTAADVVIHVPLEQYGSLDWRRYRDLIREGYDAAEAMKAQLLPFAVDEAAFAQWQTARATARRRDLPSIAFVDVDGAGSADTEVMRRALQVFAGRPMDLLAVEATLTELGGIGRYETLTWQIVERGGQHGLLVHAQPKSYAPPFLFLGVTLENTTSTQFAFGLNGRLLAFDTVGSGSELRVDAGLGSDPSLAFALYRPLWATALFVEPFAGIASKTLYAIDEHQIIASYKKTVGLVGANVGVNIGRLDEVRAGVDWGRVDANVEVGDPGLPSLSGEETRFHLDWTHDSQDSAVVPSRGVHSVTSLRHYIAAPNPDVESARKTEGVTQASGALTWVKPLDQGAVNRLFVSGGAGTSFGDHPLATEQFALGGPLKLSALDAGARRGDNFVLATGGYLRQLLRLPDFIGGSLLAGGWLENGSAFDAWKSATFDTNASVGIIAETLIGPVFVGGSFGFDGATRYYIAIGRIF